MIPQPPVITPPPPQRPRKSYGWMIVAIILIVLLAFSLLGNFTQFISHALRSGFSEGFKNSTAHEAGPRLDEVILKDNDAHNKIAVVTVDGIITGSTEDPAGNNMVDVIKAQLNRAAEDSRVKAVILKVDSPGGEVMASDQINRVITDFENNPVHGKPVICSMGSLAASGGYYISAPCRWIVANELTITGSIGVIMHGYNYRGLMDKIGVRPVTYKSGKFKDMLSPDRETNQIPPEEHAMVQGLIDETYQKFKSVVAAGRGQAHEKNKEGGRVLAPDWAQYADGRVLSGTEALKLGFVDELGDFDDAVDRAEKIAHIGNANLIEYRERYNIGDFLSMFGQNSSAKNIKLDLGLDIPKLHAGYMYFLWAPEN
ncbi:MAG TPA: signal peptide peptidase SppA [Verrucomicrobiae bacterium]|nr:signal peptide peptidase SppA [Verrucomicrobiae bacterium]